MLLNSLIVILAAIASCSFSYRAGGGYTASSGYTQAWLRGPGDVVAHVHEGIELAGGKGFVGAGSKGTKNMVVTRINTEGKLVWTQILGTKNSVGIAVVEVGDKVIVGGGLYQDSSNKQQASMVCLEIETGAIIWNTNIDHTGHGSVRGVILDGDSVVGTGYIGNSDPGFVFIADGDNAEAMAWRLDLNGALVDSKKLNIEGMSQGAKIRADPVHGGFVVVSSKWNEQDDQQCVLVKLDSSLSVEWSQEYGLASGMDQCFDMAVDSSGDYFLGGHTTAGVENWDYLALKVDGGTREQVWRHTYGQPRGFNPKWIHDEMWGVALDSEENFLLLGGSGDEYPYSEEHNGWKSDIWVSYLVVVSKEGNTLFEGVFGDPNKDANEAGEYLTVMKNGDIMIYTDSDSKGGFGFLKLTKNP